MVLHGGRRGAEPVAHSRAAEFGGGGSCALAGRKARGNQVAPCRCLPIQHFACAEYAKALFQHQIIGECAEPHAASSRNRFVHGPWPLVRDGERLDNWRKIIW